VVDGADVLQPIGVVSADAYKFIVRRTLAHVNVISYEDTTETEERCAA
jgi:hypothetical protein